MMRILICVGVLALLYEASAFKDVQDGARILPGNVLVDSSYSIPVGRRGDDKVDDAARFDDDDYTLISKMRKMETPPLPESVDYYASSRTASKRFRQRRSTLKFDGDSASSKPQQSSAASSSSSPSSPMSGDDDDEKKRLFPGLFGIGGAPYYPQHHHGYPLAGQYPMYGQGYYGGGYPGGGYHHGVGGYPGGGYPIGGGYPVGGGGGYPYPGNGLGSASASASSSSAGGFGGPGGLHGYPGGGYGNGLYGGGYYPHQGVAPILGAGLGGPGFGVIGGGFRDKDGKGEIAVSGTTSNAPASKGAGSVSFEKK